MWPKANRPTLWLAASARERAVLRVARGAQRADELGHVAEAVCAQVRGDSLVDGPADQGVVEQRRADADRGGAGDDELQRIVDGGDAALPDDRDIVEARHLVHLMHLEERDRLDRRS